MVLRPITKKVESCAVPADMHCFLGTNQYVLVLSKFITAKVISFRLKYKSAPVNTTWYHSIFKGKFFSCARMFSTQVFEEKKMTL